MSNASCWLNGAIMPAGDARISVFDHGLLYGDGVFEGIRFYNGHPFRLAAHLRRLRDSARAIHLELPYSTRELEQAVTDLIAAYAAPDGYLRLVATRGDGKLGIDPASCPRPNVFVIADKLALVGEKVRQRGAQLIVAATRSLAPDGLDPRIKSLNYLNRILARMEATQAGADEAVLLNRQGRVAEGTAENIFIVRDGALYTPPPSDGALAGITRQAVIEVAHTLNRPCSESSLTSFDLFAADECFLTGTGAELIPVHSIAGRLLSAERPTFALIQEHFAQLVQTETRTAT
ncbi:MAG: branched-chain amino acid aminotransferase [Candidatus Latescibacterota bacterium]|jgi:branched-chain amino acid aminotransferase